VASAAFAQGAVLTGTVRSVQGQPLQAANVRIAELNASVGTDSEGAYRIIVGPDRVRGQTVTVSVRAIGFKPQTRQITISAGAQHNDFTLETDINRISEVVVLPEGARETKRLAFTVERQAADTARQPNAAALTGSPFSQQLYPPELIMQNQSRLRITEAQRSAILEEIYKVQATATQVQWRVADESEKLNQLLEREAPEAEVIAQIDRLMNWEGAVKRAQLSMLIRIRNLLTPEQKALLKDLRRRGLNP
jgi:Spy/CpxP family protein refolding chaperone